MRDLNLHWNARVLLGGTILAFWPVWRWYVTRTFDGSDEPWGLLALATWVVIAVRDGIAPSQTGSRFLGAASMLGIYVLTFHLLSPLPRALIAMSGIAFVLLRRETMIASGALLALSLPVIATAQFYAGYPLRVLAAETSAATLRALNYAVTREGSLLHWRGETILVDAPCSGVRMLWIGLYFAASIAAWSRLGNARSALLLVASFALVIGANVARATALFFKEANIVAVPEWTHGGVGLFLFAGAALLIVRLGSPRPVRPCCV